LKKGKEYKEMLPHLGPTELIILVVIFLIVFGVGRLPEVGGALGRSIREFRNSIREESRDEQNATSGEVS
jgi:sec-independent protein translocase protein TatA